jgi:hypothetical protein
MMVEEEGRGGEGVGVTLAGVAVGETVLEHTEVAPAACTQLASG